MWRQKRRCLLKAHLIAETQKLEQTPAQSTYVESQMLVDPTTKRLWLFSFFQVRQQQMKLYKPACNPSYRDSLLRYAEDRKV